MCRWKILEMWISHGGSPSICLMVWLRSLGYTAAGTDYFSVLLVWLHVHFSNNFRENFVHIHPILGGSLDERTSPDLCQRHALHCGNLSLTLQINFVSDQQDWDSLCPLHPHYLVPHGFNVLKCLVVCQAVDHNKSLTILDVQIPHACKLLCSCRVQNFQNTRTIVHLNFLQLKILMNDLW